MKPSYSSFVSDYYPIFVSLGYPQLDLRWVYDKKTRQTTGEWAIYEMLNPPTIPHLTAWKDVYTGFRNVEPNRSTIARLVHSIDVKRREVWDRENAKSTRVEQEHEAVAKHRDDTIDRIHQSYVKNPDLMNRIAKNGLWEMDPRAIFRHIPRAKF